jgi:hypothetical protein
MQELLKVSVDPAAAASTFGSVLAAISANPWAIFALGAALVLAFLGRLVMVLVKQSRSRKV